MSKDTTDDETLRQELLAIAFIPPDAKDAPLQLFDVQELASFVARHVQAARLDEHNQMISMIKATDMQTQYKEYWRAGNIRLAKLQEERIAALQAQPLTDKDSV